MPTSHSKFTTGSIPAGMHHRASAIAYNPGQLAARRREGRARVHGGLSQSSINFPRAPAVATTVATPLAVAPAPSSPPVPAPASATRFADLSFETQLETALEIIHDVGRLGEQPRLRPRSSATSPRYRLLHRLLNAASSASPLCFRPQESSSVSWMLPPPEPSSCSVRACVCILDSFMALVELWWSGLARRKRRPSLLCNVQNAVRKRLKDINNICKP